MLNSLIKKTGVLLMLAASAVLAQEALSRDFLDYLAEFEIGDGEWIDPVELEMMANLGSNESATDEAVTGHAGGQLQENDDE